MRPIFLSAILPYVSYRMMAEHGFLPISIAFVQLQQNLTPTSNLSDLSEIFLISFLYSLIESNNLELSFPINSTSVYSMFSYRYDESSYS